MNRAISRHTEQPGTPTHATASTAYRRAIDHASGPSGLHGLDVTIQRRGDTALLRLDGDLDMATVSRLDDAIARVITDGATHIILDLRGLDFMGSSGIAVLHRLTDRPHVTVALIPGKPAIQRILALTGMTDVLQFVDPP
jgi:anti-anti-sigma factor